MAKSISTVAVPAVKFAILKNSGAVAATVRVEKKIVAKITRKSAETVYVVKDDGLGRVLGIRDFDSVDGQRKLVDFLHLNEVAQWLVAEAEKGNTLWRLKGDPTGEYYFVNKRSPKVRAALKKQFGRKLIELH